MGGDYGSMFVGIIVMVALISAVAGWAVIEGFLWLIGHIDISWRV